ncbi:MAG: hypothetical protein KatS3mg129_2973 [Leptospiraceae bacterium]|nr:MAG: hypothetical protein KatS3mg129_2973 [Leptospiraceae bacterium]
MKRLINNTILLVVFFLSCKTSFSPDLEEFLN